MRLPIETEETWSTQIGNPMLVTVEEAALLLRIGRTTAYELVMSGKLQSVKVGRRRLVVREGVGKYVHELLRTQNESEFQSSLHGTKRSVS
jgi:excisionase family DNA binding protein